MRAAMLLVHRYVGLLLALFLVIAGITGSLLAWNEELEAAISPQLFRVTAPPAAARIDPVLLHAQVAARYPDALAARLPLEFSDGRSVLFALRPLSKGQKLANDQVFVDPYTGQTLGQRRWGDIAQGMKNLMPFIYRLHYSLALDGIGTCAVRHRGLAVDPGLLCRCLADLAEQAAQRRAGPALAGALVAGVEVSQRQRL